MNILSYFDKILASNITQNYTLYGIVSLVLNFIFVAIIFLFIINILQMIYSDISSIEPSDAVQISYLRFLGSGGFFSSRQTKDYPIDDFLFIGRDDSNDIILNNRHISGRHAKISRIGKTYYLEDLHSSNGTFLNEEIVLQPVALRAGDIISFAGIEFEFVEGSEYDD